MNTFRYLSKCTLFTEWGWALPRQIQLKETALRILGDEMTESLPPLEGCHRLDPIYHVACQ